MIAAARKRHRAMVLLMGVVIPIVFVWGIISRQQVPILPAAEPNQIQGNAMGTFELKVDDASLNVTVYQQGPNLQLRWPQMQPLPYADILVYWLPDGDFNRAILVGNYVPNRQTVVQELADVTPTDQVELVLFALAQQQEVARAPFQRSPGGAP